MTLHGLRAGSQSPADCATAASLLGVSSLITCCSGYTPGNGVSDTFASIAGYTPFFGASNTQGYRLLLGVCMCAHGTTPVNTLANLSSFTTLATNLVSGGCGNAILRIGWEANGIGYFPWQTNATDYGNAFSAIRRTMLAVPGAAFLFDFNVVGSPDSGWADSGTYASWITAIGASNIDILSGDFYYSTSNAHTSSTYVQVLVNYAANTYNKPWAIGEWGITTADTPYFITNVGQMIAGNVGYEAPYYESYFDYGASQLHTGSTPQSDDAYTAIQTGTATTWLQQTILAAGTNIAGPIYVHGTALASFSVQPYKVGDVVTAIFEIDYSSTVPSVASLSATNINWGAAASYAVTYSDWGARLEIWEGTVTNLVTGSTTVTYNSIGSLNVTIKYMELSPPSNSGAPYLNLTGTLDSSASSNTTITFASITSRPYGVGCYIGYISPGSPTTVGSTAGFQYYRVADTSIMAWDGDLANNTAYAPTATQSPTQGWVSIAVIIWATGIPDTAPQYASTALVGSGIAPSTNDTSLTAPTHTVTVATAGANGSRIDNVRVLGLGTTVAGRLNLFRYDGTTYHLIDQIMITAVTPSASVPVYEQIVPYPELLLNSGDTLVATVMEASNESLLKITALGGSF